MATKLNRFCAAALVLLPLALLVGACSDDKGTGPRTRASSLAVFDISEVSEWNYMPVASDGSYLLINEIAGKPREVFYRPTGRHSGYMITIDAHGYPERAVIDDHIFLFDNFSGSKLDVAIISPDGSFQVLRNIDTGIDFDEHGLKSLQEIGSWIAALRIVGHAAGVAACAIGIGTAYTGIGIAVAAIGCGATVLGLVADVVPDDTRILGMSANTIGTVSTVIGCTPPPSFDCVLGAVSSGIGWFTDGYDYITERREAVDLAGGVLRGGFGDIQITLTWDSVGDLDLWVTDPYGETIKWDNRTSASGGYLDHDNIYGYGPENVFWPAGQAPTGRYRVNVHYFDGTATSTYSVLMIVGDTVLNNGRPFTGQISPDQNIHVADFTYGRMNESAAIDTFMETVDPASVEMSKP